MIDNIITVPLLTAGAFFAVSYFLNPSTIIMQQVATTEEMGGNGLTDEVVTNMISDSIQQITLTAATNRGTLVSRETARAKSVEALSDTFGLRQPIRAAQLTLGLLPYTFDGDFVKKGEGVEFRLRGVSPSYSNFEVKLDAGDATVESIREVSRDAALAILQAIDPYLVAVYRFRNESAESEASGTPDFMQTKEAIEYALIHEDRTHLPWVYALWGAVLYGEGDYEGAIVRYRQSLKLDGTFPRPMMRWGQALAAMDRHDEAIGRYKATLALDPAYPEALVLWGQSLIAKGEIAEARVMYERALAMSPDFPRIVHAYGMFEAKYGDKLVAADYLRRAVALEGGHALDRGQGAKYMASLRDVQREIDPAITGLLPPNATIPTN